MSKKYQYFAKKRNSYNYETAINPCKYKKHFNYITCKTCLKRCGYTRQKQQENNGKFGLYSFAYFYKQCIIKN